MSFLKLSSPLRQLIDEVFYLARQGVTALTAGRNNAQALAPNPPAAAAISGNLLTTPLSYTPRVSGKLLITWFAAGHCDADTRVVTFGLTVGAQVGPGQDVGTSTGAAHQVTASGVWVNPVPLALGVPININLVWQANAGTWQPNSGQQGFISVEELPE